MILRILASIVLIISILFWPLWFSIILAFGAIIYFPIFWEVVVLFLLSDLLYGVREKSYPIFISFIVAIIALVLIEIIKRETNFHRNDSKNN